MSSQDDFEVRFTDREITAWGGMALMQKMLQSIRFSDDGVRQVVGHDSSSIHGEYKGVCGKTRRCGKIGVSAVHSSMPGETVFVTLACIYRRSGDKSAAASQIDVGEDRVGTWLRESVRNSGR